jgi:DNA-binding IclR family transcriptional regulator
MDETEARQASGTQSLDAALELLQVMAGYGGPVSLSELARTCDMQPSKVHRYLAAFVKANLVAQTGRSGKYMLGPGAMQLGLAAIGQHDFVNHAAEGMADLCDETGMTALLTVWGNQGATVVRWERAPSPTVTSMGLGTTLPLLNSASGRIFLAWGPTGAIQAARDKELRRAKRMPKIVPDMEPSSEGVERLVQAIRVHGYASVHGDFIPGLVAIAAPILDWQEEAQAAITLIGTDVAATQPQSDPVLRLIAYCRQRSVLLPPQRTGTAS